MPLNVEIKAKVNDMKKLIKLTQELSQSRRETLVQEDTFFFAPNGRLKLRETQNDDNAQLIAYNRCDQKGPKVSDFYISIVNNPAELKTVLGKALGISGIVKKERIFFMVGQTKVHLDQVKDLGDFMELEVVMKDGQSVEEGNAIAQDLMNKLEIAQSDLCEGAYHDMLLQLKK